MNQLDELSCVGSKAKSSKISPDQKNSNFNGTVLNTHLSNEVNIHIKYFMFI